MISVTVTRKNGRIEKLIVSGHADYARHGKDVVCAAVSSIAQTALMGLLKYNGSVEYERKEDGYLSIVVPNDKNEAINQAVMETAVLGLKDVASGYGTFVKVEEK